MRQSLVKALHAEFRHTFKKPDKAKWRRFKQYYTSLPKKRGYVPKPA